MKKIVRVTVILALMSCLLLNVCLVSVSAKDTAEVVKQVLRSPVLFDDLARLADAVKEGTSSDVFMRIIAETYPDLVALMRKAWEEDPPPADPDHHMENASIISAGDIVLLFVLTAAGAAALAVAVTYGVMKKKAGSRQIQEKQADKTAS